MEGRKNMEEFYRKLKVGTKLKYAFTTVIVTLAIAVVVSLVSIVKMNVDTYKFYKEAYANSTLQMEIRKDIQLVGKYILWSMTTDDTGSTQSYSNLAQKYADQVGKNVTALEKSYNDKKKVAELKDAIEELKKQRAAVRELAKRPSNFRSEESVESFLIENDITGIEAIDTRALTKILRDKGTMKGMITTDENFDKDDCIKRIKAWSMGHVVLDVRCKEKMSFPGDGYKVAVIDLGVKKNIVRCLLERGCSVTVYPAETPAEEIIADAPDGIMLTNGPGDPKDNVKTIEEIKKLFATKIPIFAICLGHQLLALANGADTQKMKYGHRGAIHPVKDLKTGKVYISTQNHGYVVKEETLDRDIAEPSFINVNDKTIEGVHYLGKNVQTVQFHPEACAGPLDTGFLFDEFMNMMEVSK